MNEAHVEGLGLKSIEDDLCRIDAAGGKADLIRLMAELQHDGIGRLFEARVNTDDKQSDRYIVNLGQGSWRRIWYHFLKE